MQAICKSLHQELNSSEYFGIKDVSIQETSQGGETYMHLTASAMAPEPSGTGMQEWRRMHGGTLVAQFDQIHGVLRFEKGNGC